MGAFTSKAVYLHECATVLRNFVFCTLGVLDFVLIVFKGINNDDVVESIFKAIRYVAQVVWPTWR